MFDRGAWRRGSLLRSRPCQVSCCFPPSCQLACDEGSIRRGRLPSPRDLDIGDREVGMSRSTIRRWTELMLLLAAVGSVTAMLAGAPSALATASYADATGQRCAACHVGQPSQAVLTAEGQRFAA